MSAVPPRASVIGLKTRLIANLLRERGHLSRDELYALTPRDVIPSKRCLTKMLQGLAQKKRLKAFLPRGSVLGKDPFVYKLNPTMRCVNFPEIFGKPRHVAHLNWMISKDTTGTLERVVASTPEPANARLRAVRNVIRAMKSAI